MVGWHHRLNGQEFGWTPGVGDRQGGLACCDSWGRKESDTIEHLNCTEYAFYEKLFFFVCTYTCIWSLLVAQRVKEFAFNAGDPCWIPGSWGRSPREGNGNPLPYSCLEYSLYRGAWWTAVHGSQRVGQDWVSLTHSLILVYIYCIRTENTGDIQNAYRYTGGTQLLIKLVFPYISFYFYL